LGIGANWTVVRFLFGGAVVTLYCVGAGLAFHWAFKKFCGIAYDKMSLIQYATLQLFMISMMALPVKVVLRLAFRIKYVWVAPWFNI
jgi:hypothetical protein